LNALICKESIKIINLGPSNLGLTEAMKEWKREDVKRSKESLCLGKHEALRAPEPAPPKKKKKKKKIP
jgi:hypothetical protein